MIADLKPFSNCKPSRLPWVGEIPSHWEVIPNRAHLRRRKVLVGDRHANYQLLSLTKQGVIVRDLSKQKGKFSSDMGTSQEVRAGDLVFCLFDVPETPRTVGLSRFDGMITGAYTVFDCKDPIATSFLERFYIAMDDRKLLSPLYSGLRNTIPAPVFLGTKTPMPPPDEQALIVRFLDWASVRLGKAIAAKRKVIGLLEEQKQAIIHRAVTRGLNENVPLKPSGLDWLGDVPEHWEVRKLGRIARVTNGSTPSRFIPTYWQNGTIPWLASGKVNDYVVRTASEMITKDALRDCSVRIVPSGSIIIGMVGQGKTRGMSAITAIDACVNQNLAAVVPNPKALIPMYLLHVVTASYSFIRELGRGGNQEALNTQMIGGLRVPVPSLAEQQGIVNAIEEQTNGISFIKRKFENEIALLREYQTRLISDVVTGKVDVREVARSLPADVSEEAAELAATESADEDFATDDELIEEAV